MTGDLWAGLTPEDWAAMHKRPTTRLVYENRGTSICGEHLTRDEALAYARARAEGSIRRGHEVLTELDAGTVTVTWWVGFRQVPEPEADAS